MQRIIAQLHGAFVLFVQEKRMTASAMPGVHHVIFPGVEYWNCSFPAEAFVASLRSNQCPRYVYTIWLIGSKLLPTEGGRTVSGLLEETNFLVLDDGFAHQSLSILYQK